MAVKIPEDIDKLKSLCCKYQQQLKDLTQKCESLRLQRDMEIYYRQQEVLDFEALCRKHGIDYAIVKERDSNRRYR